ncbi:MAG: spermidine/putrescine ABC transporter substrate-binding protein [Lentisphaeria bacterium]|nr:spermidine/putrescine ABC transporter substrate-binding protein [Lentisphaeria bacterium]
MKKSILFCAVAAMMTLFLASCGKPKTTLHIYNWGDYISDEVVRDFEKEYNCRVRIDVFDSNEAMYAKLKAGAGGYDILVPYSYMAKLMYSQGMLAKIDLQKLPEVTKNFDKSYSRLSLDSEMKYTVPYFVSFTGIGYDTTKVKDFKPTWRMFEKESLKRRCSLLNDQREVLGVALRTLGYNVNSTNQKQIDEAVELIQKWKKNIAKFEVDDAKRALASGEFFLIQTYSGDMLQVSMEKPNVAFVIPKEGSTVTFDNFAIYKNSPNKDLAHAFINYMYRPAVSAKNMNEIMYVSPNTEAVKLVDEQLRKNPAFLIPEDIRSRCTPLEDLGKENVKYIKAWDKIREE